MSNQLRGVRMLCADCLATGHHHSALCHYKGDTLCAYHLRIRHPEGDTSLDVDDEREGDGWNADTRGGLNV